MAIEFEGSTFSPPEENEPRYPILDPYELGPLRDLRSELPPEVQAQLTPDDYVIEIITPEQRPALAPPSALREILRLAGVTSPRYIGAEGGPVASLASSENEHVDALRKFEVLHGRDALEISMKLHDQYPELLEATLVELAQTQGVVHEPYREGLPYRQEEPGRIMLLDRHPDDPIGKKFSKYLGWGWPFYGSIDATPTFISATVKHANRIPQFLDTPYTGRDGIHTMKDALDRSVHWVQRKLDDSPSFLLEFQNTAESGGMDAQAWKDSAFAYVHRNGERANNKDGIASLEVQALAYDALYDAASIEKDPSKARELRRYADSLAVGIFDSFWVEDPEKGSFFALGVDRDPRTGRSRQLAVRSSNMGHLLQSRLLEGNDPYITAMREATVRQLFTPEMLSYNGIRTLASDEVGFRPGGYHTGSVWLWDTARTADGLERHGYHHLAWNLRERIWRAVDETGRFPEFVRGGIDDHTETNPSEIYVWNDHHRVLHLFEQPPQEIQGWTVSAILAAKFRYPDCLKHRHTLPSSPLEQSILQELQIREV
ncbi:MAG TPA: hypothetical protein VJ841_02400 [Candidatus Saccharimonadales bacterium]|nr:hypothetical protein [Candidatus Saccharimonadales bacterium]